MHVERAITQFGYFLLGRLVSSISCKFDMEDRFYTIFTNEPLCSLINDTEVREKKEKIKDQSFCVEIPQAHLVRFRRSTIFCARKKEEKSSTHGPIHWLIYCSCNRTINTFVQLQSFVNAKLRDTKNTICSILRIIFVLNKIIIMYWHLNYFQS